MLARLSSCLTLGFPSLLNFFLHSLLIFTLLPSFLGDEFLVPVILDRIFSAAGEEFCDFNPPEDHRQVYTYISSSET